MNYPNSIKKSYSKKVDYGNRGMDLENLINISSDNYIDNEKAIIYKKPTPIQIVKYDYEKNRIVDAFYKTQSTLDYNGIYKGRYIDFEAKETNNLQCFPLENIHKHQIKHLENITKENGIGFIIVRFVKLNKTFLLYAKDLLNFINSNERKSIPLAYFEKYGYLIKESYLPRLDYLEIIDSEV